MQIVNGALDIGIGYKSLETLSMNLNIFLMAHSTFDDYVNIIGNIPIDNSIENCIANIKKKLNYQNKKE